MEKKEGAFFFFCFYHCQNPFPFVQLFDVKDDRKAFSCDFTKAFGFALVLFFLSHHEGVQGREKQN